MRLRAAGASREEGRATRQAGRELGAASFHLLLSKLAADPAAAAERYERLRSRLVLFFLRHLLATPEDLADQVIDRLARRLTEGEPIASLEAYALGVARFVLKEQIPVQRRDVSLTDVFFANTFGQNTTQDREEREWADRHEEQLDAMQACLDRLPRADADLLTSYYLMEREQRIAARRDLAAERGLTPAALRARIFQICRTLRACIDRREPRPATHRRDGGLL